MSEQMRGFSFPFHINNWKGTSFTVGSDKLKENIKHLLLTNIGERVMYRDYGGGLRQLVHDPNNDALLAIMQHQLSKAINRWEPGAQVNSVKVTQRDGELFVDVRYIAGPTQQPQSLSVPIGLGGI